MSKKFDVVIGNPPYQDDSDSEAKVLAPIYHLFMDAAYELGQKVVLITPARFLFNAGYTPSSWNQKMLTDPHLRVADYKPESNELFPGTDIKGGVAVTVRDSASPGSPISTFARYEELSNILHRVEVTGGRSLAAVITTRDTYKYTDEMHRENPKAASLMSKSAMFTVNSNAFARLPFIFHADKPSDAATQDTYIEMLGMLDGKRVRRWILAKYIAGPGSFSTFKVGVPIASGSGAFGETLSAPVVLEPGVGVTQTFLTVGSFSSRQEADACEQYIKTKFARALLGVLKVTHNNPARVWKHVPLQDFTANSDIDWSKSIPEIDQQLYAKYGLDEAEIEFIESHVKAMD